MTDHPPPRLDLNKELRPDIENPGPEWKRFDVKQYVARIEHLLAAAIQWAVFEHNSDALWTQVRQTIENFLLNEWKSGALQGSSADEAFFVKCDRTTMTQGDIDNGQLICLVGVAPVKPAEFVVLRIGQWTADHRP